MALCKSTEEQLEEVYESRKTYLNHENECEELHEMCNNCENFCGIKEQDYGECKDKACFRNWLGLEYLDWLNSYR